MSRSPVIGRAIVVGAALLALVGCQPARVPRTAAADVEPVSVHLFAFNDFHGYIEAPDTPTRWSDAAAPERVFDLPTGGAPYLAGLVAQQKALHPYSAVVAGGDLIGGSPLMSALLRHEPTIEALDAIGLEFSSVGNHEFDRGAVELKRLQDGGCHPSGENTCVDGRFGGARFRYLAANVREPSGEPLFTPWARKRFDLGGGRHVDVAFIGLVLTDTPSLVNADGIRGLRFEDEAATANALVPQIRAQGIETIVVLIHQGGRSTSTRFDDPECPGFTGPIIDLVAKLDPAIDVVVSAHTHRTYVCRLSGRLVTSAGNEGRFLTDIDLRIDPRSGDVVASEARQLAVINDGPNPLADRYARVAPSAALAARVDTWRTRFAPLAKRVVGRIDANLTRRADVNGETVLGDVIADAWLDASAAAEAGGARVAFVNNGGLRSDLNAHAGGVTYEEVYAVHPFGNLLVTMTLTGEQIHRLLETQWQGAGSLLQASQGFSYEWSASAPPGARIDPASIRLDGKLLDPAASYRVTVTDFLANGGDGYTVLKEGRQPRIGLLDVDVLDAWLEHHSPLAAPERGRIRRVP